MTSADHGPNAATGRARRRWWPAWLVAAACAALLVPSGEANLPRLGALLSNEARFSAELGSAAKASDLAAFYSGRGNAPIWLDGGRLRPGGEAVLAMIEDAGNDGLDPARYRAAELRALATRLDGDPRSAAVLELGLSRAYADFARDLRQSSRDAAMAYADMALVPRTDARALLSKADGSSPAELRRMNPIYEELRRALSGQRRGEAPPPGLTRTAYQALLLANMDRARALPAGAGRYLLVDAASARLWMIEDDKVHDTMRVIVGKRDQQTPALAGTIGFAVLNPYWNLPPDLMRTRARRIVREGPGLIAAERLELLSDWGASPRVLAAAEVDWPAVASGKTELRARQLPGGANMMGAIKFMLPNRLGIYLHDTPNKALFAQADRRLSSGCVRVEDAARLARWLFGGAAPRPSDVPEQRVDLPDPVPVYITYLTALPENGRIVVQPDAYGRDAALARSLSRAS